MVKLQETFITHYLTTLLDKAGFGDEDERELLIEDLRPLLHDRIVISLASRLNDEQRKEVGTLLEEDKMEEIDSLVRDTIPDYDEFLADILIDFEEEYLAEMNS